MASQQDHEGLNWLQPGKRELTIVGTYVADEAPKLHPGFGGTSRFDLVEQAEFVLDAQPHRRLEQALRAHINKTLQIQVATFDSSLCDKIASMEKAYGETNQGLWHRLWYGMGDSREVVEAWIGLIPDAYGLSVVKTGVAVVFKLAENSKEKRERVFKTFDILGNAVVSLHPDHARFRADSDVSDSATSLYEAVLAAIEDMVEILSTREKSARTRFAAKFKSKSKTEETPPTLDSILETLETAVEKYNGAISLARDRTAERVEAYGQYNAVAATHIFQGIGSLRKRADQDAAIRREQERAQLNALRRGEKELRRLVEAQTATRNDLVKLILEAKKQGAIEAEQAALRQQASLNRRRKAVVSLAGLCDILARPLSASHDPDSNPNLDRVYQHPSVDLGHALAEQSRLPQASQGQVQSLLAHERFLHWLSHPHPSLILVDANIRESSLDRLSAISVFSSTLATSLTQAYPDDAAVVHFFCGMHASPSDALYGPTGLVRSLILQLLMKLDAADPDMREWDLNFIHDRAFLQRLEQHSLPDLCVTLHELLSQFRPDTHVYCIIDSISCFDVGRLLPDLGTVMEQLRLIVTDPNLAPVLKVLVTNPGQSTRAIKSMPLFAQDPARIVSLSRQDRVPGGRISARAVDDHLLRAPSPLLARRRTPSPFRRSREPSPAARHFPMSSSAAGVHTPDDSSGYGSDGGAYWDGSSDGGRRWSHNRY